MLNRFSRMELVVGPKAMERLKNCRIAVFGVGGVGGYVVEALARSAVGQLDLIDNDDVSLTNINRQIIALSSTIGQPKVLVAKERILDINPECNVRTYQTFYLPETADQFDFSQYDYIVDAIDTVTAKLDLIEKANQVGVPVISAMGAGNKLDPTAFQVSDIYKTSVDPLARVIRRECKKRGVRSLKVVYSQEEPVQSHVSDDLSETEESSKRSIPGSTAFVPPVVGLIMASEVIKDLIKGL